MNIIRLLKKNIITKKILQNSGRIALAFLPEIGANTLNILFRLCKFMRVSASFLSDYQPHIGFNYIPNTKFLKAISIATS